MNSIMMPNWFLWIFVGGLVFITLNFTAAKYNNKDYKRMNALQDFIGGLILVTLVGMLVPDLFPKIELPTGLPSFSVGSMIPGFEMSDVDLQVGPPRLIGK